MNYCPNPDCPKPSRVGSSLYCQGCGNLLDILRNRYRSVKVIGQGGFGRTFLAEDLDRLNQYCVIKQFCPDVQGGQAFDIAKGLFEKEAQQLQELGEHPQIPALHAYFEENNQLYLVQQYIEGETLEQELLRQGTFTQKNIIQVLQETLEILEFVHSKQVIHRDIKPSNIIRAKTPASNGKSLFLIDFGVAKQLSMIANKTTGTMIGSPGYAPVEQMMSGKVSLSSDLYSLGITCFYLLTGMNPWDLAQTKGHEWTSHWQDYLNYNIDPKLEAILSKLLAKDTEARFQSAAEVLALFPLGKSSGNISRASGVTQFVSRLKTILVGSEPKLGQPNTLKQPDSELFIQPGFSSPQIIAITILSLVLISGGLGLAKLAFSNTFVLCSLTNNCPPDPKFLPVYSASQAQAQQAITFSNGGSSLAELEKNKDRLNQSIKKLKAIPKESNLASQVEQDIKNYQQNLGLISSLIESKKKQDKMAVTINDKDQIIAKNNEEISALKANISSFLRPKNITTISIGKEPSPSLSRPRLEPTKPPRSKPSPLGNVKPKSKVAISLEPPLWKDHSDDKKPLW